MAPSVLNCFLAYKIFLSQFYSLWPLNMQYFFYSVYSGCRAVLAPVWPPNPFSLCRLSPCWRWRRSRAGRSRRPWSRSVAASRTSARRWRWWGTEPWRRPACRRPRPCCPRPAGWTSPRSSRGGRSPSATGTPAPPSHLEEGEWHCREGILGEGRRQGEGEDCNRWYDGGRKRGEMDEGRRGGGIRSWWSTKTGSRGVQWKVGKWWEWT